jgi:hypothetical protein
MLVLEMQMQMQLPGCSSFRNWALAMHYALALGIGRMGIHQGHVLPFYGLSPSC